MPTAKLIPANLTFAIDRTKAGGSAPVHTLKIGDYLVKGDDKKNADLCASCKKLPHKCLCYYWKCGDTVFYVGSATPYKYQKISLLVRLLNYL